MTDSTLWGILENWSRFHLVARLRCDICGRKFGEVRRRTLNSPALGVLVAGSSRRWETADDDDPEDPGMLFGVDRWARATWLNDPSPSNPNTFGEVVEALNYPVGAHRCPKCNRAGGWYFEWVSPAGDRRTG